MRIAIDLADRYVVRNETTKPRGTLAPVPHAFTQGLNTKDLQRAANVLGKLEAPAPLEEPSGCWTRPTLRENSIHRSIGGRTCIVHTLAESSVTTSALGCEGCLHIGSPWVHLRLCRSCGHVGCCDLRPIVMPGGISNRQGHPIIEGYDPPKGWGWCFIDDPEVDLGSQTLHNGPIPRFI